MMKNKDSFLNHLLLSIAAIMMTLVCMTVVSNFGLVSIPSLISFVLTAISYYLGFYLWKN